MSEQKKVETTGHQWDDEDGNPLRELNNPLPSWWLYGFYATIAWAVVYWVLYPTWPMANDFTRGTLGWTMRGELQEEMAEAEKIRKPFDDKIAATPIQDVAKDPKLLSFAVAGGKAIFGDKCAPCHGSGGVGSRAQGFPILADDDWLFGGTLPQIVESITAGRAGMMPAHLNEAGGGFTKAQVEDLAAYVTALSGGSVPTDKFKSGEKLFHGDAGCNNCHGDKGEGAVTGTVKGQAIDDGIGAPTLMDKIWLYGGEPETIFKSIAYGRSGKMPAWGDASNPKRLTELEIKKVALYVHGLGGGKK